MKETTTLYPEGLILVYKKSCSMTSTSQSFSLCKDSYSVLDSTCPQLSEKSNACCCLGNNLYIYIGSDTLQIE